MSERKSGAGSGTEATPEKELHGRDPVFGRTARSPLAPSLGATGGGTAQEHSSRPGHDEPPELSFTTPGGRRHHVAARFGRDLQRVVRPPRVAREVRLGDAWQGLQVRLCAADASDPHEYHVLETEVGVALTVHRAFSGTPFQGLFPVPVGYDMDAAEPFLIYADPRGEPATSLAHGISTTDQRIIERDLVLAIRLLESLGLVHRGIVPAAVRWDGERTQLWDLGAVARTGTPRAPWGAPPYASPEQRAGVGDVEARDALWSAAQLMYQLVAGRQGSPDGPPADLEAHRSLVQTLGGAFAPKAEDRPTPGKLLGLLMPDSDPYAMVAARPDPLEPHRREFDAALARKRAAAGLDLDGSGPHNDPHPTEPLLAPDGTGQPGRRRAWFNGGTGDRGGRGRR
ncbi:hypothetical protein [Streptomyces sp. NPDC002889]|uniref:hypothetical protein n=1 Tax=Streptomyces sp. NPDC002889 TaxID=3364669 RepID=UPI00369F4C0B